MASQSPTSTNSSLSSGSRFGLDERDTRKILVYKHPYGLETSSQSELCKLLNNERNLRCSRVVIPWGDSHVDIHQRDLFTDKERAHLVDKPSMNLSLASVNLGRMGHLKRLFGLQKHLYIISPESSPNSSPEHSQNVSPNATFKSQNEEERMGQTSPGAEFTNAS